MAQPPTSIRNAWALIRRNGDTIGKRPSTRMAFLIGTVVGPDGKAVAWRGHIMNNDMTGWTKHPRRVEFGDVIRTWRFDRQPKVTQVLATKAKLPVVKDWSDKHAPCGGSPYASVEIIAVNPNERAA